MKLEWSEPAIEDLRNLHVYIAKDSPHYARQFIERLLIAVEPLVEFPEMGRHVPETDAADVRELIVQGYRIIYQIEAPTRVVILAVVHGRRDLGQNDIAARKSK
jgi:addiction module RelE/StbE family toxin